MNTPESSTKKEDQYPLGTFGVIHRKLSALPERVQIWQEAIPEARVIGYESFADLMKEDTTQVYCGFAVDFQSMIGAATSEKSTLSTIEEVFPIVRVIENVSAGTWKGTLGNQNFGSQKEILEAARLEVQKCRPRGMRRYSRIRLFSPLYFRILGSENHPLPCTTVNVSRGGVFITGLGNHPEISIGSLAEVEFFRGKPRSELERLQPLSVRVSWRVGWAEQKNQIPGVGLQFLRTDGEAYTELLRHFGILAP